MTKLTVAALQLAFSEDTVANIKAVAELVREAHAKGAEVVLPPELFEGPYFCRTEDEARFADARATAEHPSVLAMQELAAELKIWIPTSFFEAEDSTTGTEPTSSCFMTLATLATESPGWQQTGSRVITSLHLGIWTS